LRIGIKRVERIAEKASTWAIGALSGIPSWIELMLKSHWNP